ncbi:MAG: type II toxin-antitoxin system HipA family toxin [Myxococcales bacterium]|nr:type II toxin-antitoxin system HipA family toxin [Myxococcales bacterium]
MKFAPAARLEVRLERKTEDVQLVGQLALLRGQVAFEFSPEFLAHASPLSPLRLPLKTGLQSAREGHLMGLFGVFDDSLPDGWGRLLMDRTFLARNVRLRELSVLDRLAYLGRHTMGALTYHPCTEPEGESHEALDLAALAKASRQIYDGSAVEILPALRLAGGSPGGARPKVLVGIHEGRVLSGVDTLPPGFEAWLVKFATHDDPPNAGPIEYLYARMAMAAGIKMPEVRLLGPLPDGERCFAVRRFDRDGDTRIHVHTLANLLHANFREPNLDYEHLLRVARQLTRNHVDVKECFRRAVFNLLTSNRDDHGKNFAFLMQRDGSWTVSPAYDLMLADGPGGEHTMTYKGEGRRPTWSHLEQLAELAQLSSTEALQILAEVRDGIGRWQSEATKLKLPAAQIREVGQRFTEVAAAAALPTPVLKPRRPSKRP